jgi:hypothetical protein
MLKKFILSVFALIAFMLNVWAQPQAFKYQAVATHF